jgi:Holliday junction resolvase-like predicted endonuclease
VFYTLDFPNREVKNSFLQSLLSFYTSYPYDESAEISKKIIRQIKTADEKGLKDNLTQLLAHLPYQIRVENEKYYHSIFLIWLRMLGFDMQGEVSTDKGRIDAVLKQDDFAAIVEIKYGVEKPLDKMLESALKQIEEKKYYEAYSGKKIILLGIAFNGKEVKCKFGDIN